MIVRQFMQPVPGFHSGSVHTRYGISFRADTESYPVYNMNTYLVNFHFKVSVRTTIRNHDF